MNKVMKGFTLVEIMIVVAIIAILAAVAIPNFVKYRKTSQMNACISNLKQIQSAYEQAKMAGTTVSDVADLCGKAGYIKTTPTCPADPSATYSLPTDEDGVPTCSYGATAGDQFKHELPAASGNAND